eukprot:gene4820-6755_t
MKTGTVFFFILYLSLYSCKNILYAHDKENIEDLDSLSQVINDGKFYNSKYSKQRHLLETDPSIPLKPSSLMGVNLKVQRAAVKAWSLFLTEHDYNASNWKSITHRSQPQDFFDYYITKLSDLFLEMNAIVNFALVGACDGTNDRTIRDRYLPYNHWRGVFVEPISMNYKDLNNFMESNGVTNRTHLIHGAATSHCVNSTIKMKRPTHEEKNSSLPHWMRRQIGAIVPFDKLERPMTGGWTAEFVRCVTGSDILEDWAAATSRNVNPSKRQKVPKKMRAHVLKIDAEGHDYDVLMSFLPDDVPNNELPLLINFEAKSIAEKFPLAKSNMEKRGYIVSNFATDGFAMLRGDSIYGKGKKPKRVSQDNIGSEAEVAVESIDSSAENAAGGHGQQKRNNRKRKGKKGKKANQAND